MWLLKSKIVTLFSMSKSKEKLYFSRRVQNERKKRLWNISFIWQIELLSDTTQKAKFTTENSFSCLEHWIVSKWWVTGISGLIEFNQQEKLKQFIVNVHFIYKCWLSQLQSYKVTKRQKCAKSFFQTAKTKIATTTTTTNNIESVRIVPKTLLLCDL